MICFLAFGLCIFLFAFYIVREINNQMESNRIIVLRGKFVVTSEDNLNEKKGTTNFPNIF